MANFRPRIKLPVIFHPVLRRWRLLTVVTLTGLVVALSWQLVSFYQRAFYPQTYINGVAVGDLTLSEALILLERDRPTPPPFTLLVSTDQTLVASSSTQLSAEYRYAQTVPQIFARAHQGSWWQQLRRLAGTTHESYASTIELSPLALDQLVAVVATQTNQPGVRPAVKLGTSGKPQSLDVQIGKSGQRLDLPATRRAVLDQIETFSQTWRDPAAWQAHQASLSENSIPKLTVSAVITPTTIPLTVEEAAQTEALAKTLVGKHLSLKLQTHHFEWNDQKLVSFILPPDQLDTEAMASELEKINASLPDQPTNAELTYNPDTLQVTKFVPGKDGLTINQTESLQQITQIMTDWLHAANSESARDLTLPATIQPPAVTLDKTNSLGINQLIGFGESFYAHSIPSRIHNVALTAKKINFTIVKPGEEFSFNKTLGDVSAATGFRPAYVIQSGQTVLGDGGGVCQVSSTLFRASLNAGLNITRRLPHSYRVSYYELNSQAGFDATVYSGNVDFRFINDTPGHLLIYTETDSSKLWMKVEIYGTSDGRTATITDYKSGGATPPKPTEYITDPSLPHGVKKQIDWPAAGLKTSFVYTVKDAAGNIKQKETYSSNYQAWAAKFLVGP